MKKVVAMLCMLFTLFGLFSLPSYAAATDDLRLYEKIIKLYRQFSNTHPILVALYDIDGNGIKELLLELDGDSQILFTIRNGKAVELLNIDFENFYPIVIFENGTVQRSFNDGRLNIRYYRFINGEFKLQETLDREDDNEYYRYNPDRTRYTITETEFNQLTKQYEGNGKKVKLKWEQLEILWLQKLPRWLQFILRYILFGWAWMK